MNTDLKNIPKEFLKNTLTYNNYNTEIHTNSIKNKKNSNNDNIWILIIILILFDII